MYSKTFTIFVAALFLSCNNNTAKTHDINKPLLLKDDDNFNPYPSIGTIPLPAGFSRLNNNANPFAEWLLQVPLKKDKRVHLYDGNLKRNQSAQFAVLDISTGNKNLQQCADAVMRLRAEYLFASQQYSRIVFFDNENKSYQFSAPHTKEHLHRYLQIVFGMCGSASLSKQLHKKLIKDIEAGDVLIRGGFPGHAVIVMDVAADDKGDKIFMLAQSYMPAQDIHVLINVDDSNSPWYHLPQGKQIETPEYVFVVSELKGW